MTIDETKLLCEVAVSAVDEAVKAVEEALPIGIHVVVQGRLGWIDEYCEPMGSEFYFNIQPVLKHEWRNYGRPANQDGTYTVPLFHIELAWEPQQ